MIALTRRGALAGIAGASAIAARAANGTTVSSARERALPAQTEWPPPPPLVPAREGLAELPETRLWFQDTGGEGEPIVFCHPWTGSYAIWGYQQRTFVAAGYRVITYSMRGYYRSGRIDPAAPGSGTADLRQLLGVLGIGRAHIVGSAGGGLPALELALTDPERVSSVTVASSHMGISDPDFLEIGGRMFPPGVYGISHAFSEIGPSYRAGCPEGVAAWEAHDELAWQGGSVRQGTEEPITLDRISAIAVPLMLITGDADLMMPPSRMRGVARRVPEAELVVVAEAGHSLYWEQPEAFNAAALDFIGRHPAPVG